MYIISKVITARGGIVFSVVDEFFYARQLYRQVLLRARISYGISVRPSVCLSVTTRWYTKHR